MGTPGIYSITSKVNQKIYVGSSVDTRKRWATHKSHLRRGIHANNHLQAHVNKYGLGDLVFAIEEVEPDQTLRLGLEQLLVTALYGKGCFNLSVSVTDPMHGRKHSPESIAKMRLPKSPEHKAKIGAASKGRLMSEAHKARLKEINTGRPLTPEHKAKLSLAIKGRTVSPEQRERLTESNRNRVISEETRAKMSASAKRRCSRG